MDKQERRKWFQQLLLSVPFNKFDSLKVSKNPNLYMDFVLAHPEIPWNAGGLSSNPNLTIEAIRKFNLHKIHYYGI